MSGFVGENDDIITNAMASGNVTVASSELNTIDRVGGFAGSNVNTLINVTASGNVNGSTLVGGLVGENIRSSEFGSSDFFQPRIENVAAFGGVTGEKDVGGLIGSQKSNETIQNGFATGRVTGNNSLGGLVDTVESGSTPTITEAYWDTQATGQTTSAGSATGLTTTEMQGQSAAENMNLTFGETWQTVSGDYPELIALADSDADSDSNSETDTDLVAEYAGEDDTVGSFDVITAIDDFRQQQLGPFEVLKIIQAFRD